MMRTERAAAAMKRFLPALLALALSAAASAQPAYVVDRVDVLTDAQERALFDRLAALDDSTSVQIGVMVNETGGIPIRDAARYLLGEGGAGQMGVNNGAVILLAPAGREVFVSVGTGAEWQVPDDTAAVVVRQMVARFREGDYAGGLTAGVEALAGRMGAVPWGVRYASAAEVVTDGAGALGQIARVEGVVDGDRLATGAGPARLYFPPHWDGACLPFADGERVDLLGRVAGTDPLAVQVLGPAPGTSCERPAPPWPRDAGSVSDGEEG